MVAALLGPYVARGRPFPSTLKQPNVKGESLLEVAQALAALGR